MKILKMWYSGFKPCLVSPTMKRIYVWKGVDWTTGEIYTLYRYTRGEYYMQRGFENLFRVTIRKRGHVPILQGGYDLVNNGDRTCYLYY